MESAPLSCVFAVNTELKGYEKKLDIIYKGIEGLVTESNPLDVSNSLVYLHGQIDPRIFIKKLYKLRSYIAVYRIDYGYEADPQGTRKPNSHFMTCCFELDTSDISWYKKIRGALKNIQGVSFTIDVQPVMGYPMVYLRGNIEMRVLLKTLNKTGIKLPYMKYGGKYKDANLNQPQNETEAQQAKDRAGASST